MTQHANRFVVGALTARRMDGSEPEATFELSMQSLNTEIVVGRDKLGRPIAETRPLAYSQPWGTSDGCINHVPMRTGTVFKNNPDAKAYESETTYDLIMAGWIPLHVCPYTDLFRAITNTRCLVANPTNEPDCGGKPDGCEHLHALLAERRAAVAQENEEKEAQFRKMSPKQAQALADQMQQAFSIIASAARADDDEDSIAKPSRPRAK